MNEQSYRANPLISELIFEYHTPYIIIMIEMAVSPEGALVVKLEVLNFHRLIVSHSVISLAAVYSVYCITDVFCYRFSA